MPCPAPPRKLLPRPTFSLIWFVSYLSSALVKRMLSVVHVSDCSEPAFIQPHTDFVNSFLLGCIKIDDRRLFRDVSDFSCNHYPGFAIFCRTIVRRVITFLRAGAMLPGATASW